MSNTTTSSGANATPAEDAVEALASALEAVLHEHGVHIDTVRGVSMKPLLRQGVDAVQIASIDPSADGSYPGAGELRRYDVILYRVPGPEGKGKLLLHRIVGTDDAGYRVLGDNTVAIEHVRRDQVIGKMTGFWRDQKRVELDSWAYRLYVNLWCKPWRVRIPFLKARLALKRRLGLMPDEQQ